MFPQRIDIKNYNKQTNKLIAVRLFKIILLLCNKIIIKYNKKIKQF